MLPRLTLENCSASRRPFDDAAEGDGAEGDAAEGDAAEGDAAITLRRLGPGGVSDGVIDDGSSGHGWQDVMLTPVQQLS